MILQVLLKNILKYVLKKDMLDRYNRLPYKYKSKIGYDNFIQNVILKELTNIMGTIITDLDIELKMEISRIEFLESKNSYECKYTLA